jgi:hypothetical protein
MDWSAYKELGVGSRFEDKPGRQRHPGGGSGWHWHTVHRPDETYQGGAPPLYVSSRDELQPLPLAELQARANDAGVDPDRLEEALGSDDPREQLITLCEIVLIDKARHAADLALYPLPPEAQRSADGSVPVGSVTHHEGWTCNEFPETTREYWVYVPQQYEPGTAAKLGPTPTTPTSLYFWASPWPVFLMRLG